MDMGSINFFELVFSFYSINTWNLNCWMMFLFYFFEGLLYPSMVIAPVYFLTNSAQEFPFLHIFANTRVKWHHIVALICVVLMVNDAEHIFMYLLVIYVCSFGKIVYSDLPPIFESFFFFFLSCVCSSCILDISSLLDIWFGIVLVVVIHLLSHIQLFVTLWTTARQVPLSSTISYGLLYFMFIEFGMLSNHCIFYHPLFLLRNLSQHQGLFQWINSLHHVAKILELQHQQQSFQWIFSIDFL